MLADEMFKFEVDVGRLNVRVRVLHQRTKLSRHDCRGTHSSSSTSRRAATANKRGEEDEDLQVNMKINAIRCKLVTKILNSIREEFTSADNYADSCADNYAAPLNRPKLCDP